MFERFVKVVVFLCFVPLVLVTLLFALVAAAGHPDFFWFVTLFGGAGIIAAFGLTFRYVVEG